MREERVHPIDMRLSAGTMNSINIPAGGVVVNNRRVLRQLDFWLRDYGSQAHPYVLINFP